MRVSRRDRFCMVMEVPKEALFALRQAAPPTSAEASKEGRVWGIGYFWDEDKLHGGV